MSRIVYILKYHIIIFSQIYAILITLKENILNTIFTHALITNVSFSLFCFLKGANKIV